MRVLHMMGAALAVLFVSAAHASLSVIAPLYVALGLHVVAVVVLGRWSKRGYRAVQVVCLMLPAGAWFLYLSLVSASLLLYAFSAVAVTVATLAVASLSLGKGDIPARMVAVEVPSEQESREFVRA